MIENRALEGMWKEQDEGLFEVLPRYLDDFSSLSHRKHSKLFLQRPND
jgi:hypothetical protein